jgi:hypothetical protein
MIDKAVEVKKFTFNKCDDYLIAIGKENIYINYNDAVEITKERLIFAEELSHKLLIKVPQSIIITKNARDYLSSPEGVKNIECIALVVQSSYSLFLVKIIINLIKNPNPIKIFSSEEKAVLWLKNQ